MSRLFADICDGSRLSQYINFHFNQLEQSDNHNTLNSYFCMGCSATLIWVDWRMKAHNLKKLRGAVPIIERNHIVSLNRNCPVCKVSILPTHISSRS